jgi:hypothetical protein
MTDHLIKLNDKGVRVYLTNVGGVQRAQPDWRGRTGKVVNYSRDRSLAYVVWDGNRSVDRVPVSLIEPADRRNFDQIDKNG